MNFKEYVNQIEIVEQAQLLNENFWPAVAEVLKILAKTLYGMGEVGVGTAKAGYGATTALAHGVDATLATGLMGYDAMMGSGVRGEYPREKWGEAGQSFQTMLNGAKLALKGLSRMIGLKDLLDASRQAEEIGQIINPLQRREEIEDLRRKSPEAWQLIQGMVKLK